MNSVELRLGNYVMIHDYAKGNRQQVVDQLDVCQINLLDEQYCSPIPITKEWILKFGFKEPKYTSIYSIELKYDFNFTGYLDYNLETKSINLSYGFWVTNCLYVHQLQNLYFALTGKELTIQKT